MALTSAPPAGSSDAASIVETSLSGGVFRLTLNRPALHNALNRDMLDLLLKHLSDARHNPDVRVVVLGARGPNFSAGVDLAHMARLNTLSRAESVEDGLAIAEVLAEVATLPMPTIAAVQGPVFGGGLALICAFDMIVASTEARFSAAETRLGLTPVLLAPYLASKVGGNTARRLLLNAGKFEAAEAQRIGLVDQLVEPGALDDTIARTCRRLQKSAPGALAATKRLLAGAFDLPLTPAAMRDAAEKIATARAGQEAAEGIAAFLEKRPAAWADGEG